MRWDCSVCMNKTLFCKECPVKELKQIYEHSKCKQKQLKKYTWHFTSISSWKTTGADIFHSQCSVSVVHLWSPSVTCFVYSLALSVRPNWVPKTRASTAKILWFKVWRRFTRKKKNNKNKLSLLIYSDGSGTRGFWRYLQLNNRYKACWTRAFVIFCFIKIDNKWRENPFQFALNPFFG